MKRSEMMDQIEEKFLNTQAGDFNSVDHALIVAASALQYLADKCDLEEEAPVLDPLEEATRQTKEALKEL